MNIAFFSAKPYDIESFRRANASGEHEITFFEPRLTPETCSLAAGFPAVCAFVNDHLDAPVLHALAAGGTRLIALRSAGFNNVDLQTARALRMTVAHVPAYSPHAVAEHTVALMLTLNRKIHRAYNRIREGNFSLDGLLGFDMNTRIAGVVGTGRIGELVARILTGIGCTVLAFDMYQNPRCLELGVRYVDIDELLAGSDIITLHCPLTAATQHLINAESIAGMRTGVMLINTGRGALVDTSAVVEGLKSGKIGSVGLDVYEEEEQLFFEDRSSDVIQDDVFSRLLTFPNVVVTGHQAFFTAEAMANIASTTLTNVTAFEFGLGGVFVVKGDQ